jgi:hypothetical protein
MARAHEISGEVEHLLQMQDQIAELPESVVRDGNKLILSQEGRFVGREGATSEERLNLWLTTDSLIIARPSGFGGKVKGVRALLVAGVWVCLARCVCVCVVFMCELCERERAVYVCMCMYEQCVCVCLPMSTVNVCM